MSDIIQANIPIPLPVKSDVVVRQAVAGDLAFIDRLQRMHSKNVGWMASSILERKMERGEILIADRVPGSGSRVPGEESAFPEPGTRNPEPIGYCMGQDRYLKRDDVGIIYQMNIEPGRQRGLVGATLLKAMFDRSAYGCRLYCCWCAQDLSANKFWEAMGFVALAFRAGSEKKSRVHIFWQKRIRAGDEVTPWWFPAKTEAGAMREDRLVLPIPPGKHWSEEMPRIVPEEERVPGSGSRVPEGKRLGSSRNPEPGTRNPMHRAGPVRHGPRQFGPPPSSEEIARMAVEKAKPACPEQGRREKVKKVKRKADPKHVAASRELRDRYLEQVNAPGGERLLMGCGKYDVSRALAEASVVGVQQVKQITSIAA